MNTEIINEDLNLGFNYTKPKVRSFIGLSKLAREKKVSTIIIKAVMVKTGKYL
jgi:hypothetical protein